LKNQSLLRIQCQDAKTQRKAIFVNGPKDDFSGNRRFFLTGLSADNPQRFSWRLGVLALALAFLPFAGCRGKSKIDGALPLPPSADSGVYDGQFIQTDYGFAISLPPKWVWVRLSSEQEVDEVARFSDPTRDLMVRVSVQIKGDDQALTKKSWEQAASQDLKNHQFTLQKMDSPEEWKTGDSGPWIEVPFRMTDPRGDRWADQEWALNRGDLWVVAHATLPQATADSESGRKIFKSLEGALTQIHWLTPIGPRGISVERFELQHFTEGFRSSLESGSLAKTSPYFDDMYPDRSKWNAWYQQAVSGDPKSFELKAELSGLVINGDYAAASFTLDRKDKNDSHSGKFERNFKLSKKEGSWKITATLDKN
jgi:hypothetical protein